MTSISKTPAITFLLSFIITTVMVVSATATFAQAPPSWVPTNGLIGWWSFTGNADDDSGNNNNGTSNGAVPTTDRFGNANSAYLFDGTSSYISIPNSVSLQSPSTALTMCAWVNLAGYSLVGQAFDPVLTKSNSSANGFMYRFTVNINGDGFYAGTNNWTTNIGVLNTLALNQWYLLTAVLDADTAFIYLDDSLLSATAFATNIISDNLPLEIGRDTPGSTEVFNGKIDDIGIWNVALTPQQVSGLYLGPTAGIHESASPNPIVVYPNPAANQIHVKMNTQFENSPYIITNLMGKTVLTGTLNLGNNIIPTGNLPAGIYMLSVGKSSRQMFNVVH